MEFPTEKEIISHIKTIYRNEQTIASVNYSAGFLDGAKWLKNFIENQENSEPITNEFEAKS
jgi:hypothetical protein